MVGDLTCLITPVILRNGGDDKNGGDYYDDDADDEDDDDDNNNNDNAGDDNDTLQAGCLNSSSKPMCELFSQKMNEGFFPLSWPEPK